MSSPLLPTYLPSLGKGGYLELVYLLCTIFLGYLIHNLSILLNFFKVIATENILYMLDFTLLQHVHRRLCCSYTKGTSIVMLFLLWIVHYVFLTTFNNFTVTYRFSKSCPWCWLVVKSLNFKSKRVSYFNLSTLLVE